MTSVLMTKRLVDASLENGQFRLTLLLTLLMIVFGFFSAKRTVDLGFSRGFSGSQAAKHLMGLVAANYAHGPGRKRRSVEDDGVAVSGGNVAATWH